MFDLDCRHGSMRVAKSNFVILLLLMLVVPTYQPHVNWGITIALQDYPVHPVNSNQP